MDYLILTWYCGQNFIGQSVLYYILLLKIGNHMMKLDDEVQLVSNDPTGHRKFQPLGISPNQIMKTHLLDETSLGDLVGL